MLNTEQYSASQNTVNLYLKSKQMPFVFAVAKLHSLAHHIPWPVTEDVTPTGTV